MQPAGYAATLSDWRSAAEGSAHLQPLIHLLRQHRLRGVLTDLAICLALASKPVSAAVMGGRLLGCAISALLTCCVGVEVCRNAQVLCER